MNGAYCRYKSHRFSPDCGNSNCRSIARGIVKDNSRTGEKRDFRGEIVSGQRKKTPKRHCGHESGEQNDYTRLRNLWEKFKGHCFKQNRLVEEMTELLENQMQLAKTKLKIGDAKIRRLEFEADNKQFESRRNSKTEIRGGPHDRCFRCNLEGHVSTSCPLKEYGMWFCYYCQALVAHKGTDCPSL